MTKEELISYEQGIAALFNDGAIRHPVHLARQRGERATGYRSIVEVA